MSAVKEALARIKEFWSHITFSQRVIIGVAATFCIVVFFGLVLWLNTPEMQVLYNNLNAEDAGRVVKSLEDQNITFKFSEDGKAILVPSDQVYTLRMKIAGEGSIQGSGLGFEMFNEVQLGQTEFVQKINYQRALQGELARTLTAFPMVENARVHLVLPRKSLFIEEQQKPSASVVLKLAGNGKMDQRDVMSIVNLLTMSVEGLDKTRVSIADTSGKVLFQPEEEGALQLSGTQVEMTNMTQARLERRIEDLLTPMVGTGKVKATVNADLDFSQRTIRREIFDPESAVVRSERRSEESRQGRANLDSGVPETNFRGDGFGGTQSTSASNRETRDTNYEINKEEQNIVGQLGAVNRLSVAVIVDGLYEKDQNGNNVYAPRTEEDLKRIRALVAGAVGFDSARGDVIEVSSVAFSSLEQEIPQDIADVITDYTLRLGKPFLNALLIFLFLIMVVRPVVMALIRPKVEGEMIEGLEGLPLPSGDERLALIDASDDAVEALATLEKIEDIKAHSIQLSEQNMDQALGIIRSWLKVPEAA
ncbi:flagellar M-ring protein FliF [Desulfovibrio sp. OttesenSCG-928-O18]|nr:flagellar M-ring protein FliF [Desulfovibrio sp. OttesenSCG-928-O18]